MACREHLLEMIAEKGVSGLKGKQLFPHELVQQVLNPKRGEPSDAVCAILNIQWEAVRNGLLEMVEARKAEQAQASMLVDNVAALVTASKLCTQSTVLSGWQSTRPCCLALGPPVVSRVWSLWSTSLAACLELPWKRRLPLASSPLRSRTLSSAIGF